MPLTDRSQIVRTFDDHLRTPYVQNWNLTIERELPGSLLLDLRYVGSKGTKLIRSADINEDNIFENGIRDAFVAAQSGGNSPLLDSIFRGLNLGLGRVNGTTVTGAASVRAFSNTRSFFANNDAGGFADYLNTTADFTDVRGGLLSRAGLPDNFIVGNPQFIGAHFVGNFANSTYHSMQLNLEKRFASGSTLQSNYTFSRTIGEDEGAPRIFTVITATRAIATSISGYSLSTSFTCCAIVECSNFLSVQAAAFWARVTACRAGWSNDGRSERSSTSSLVNRWVFPRIRLLSMRSAIQPGSLGICPKARAL